MSSRCLLVPALLLLALVLAGTTIYLLLDRSRAENRPQVLLLATAVPSPTPTPLPTRDPEVARLQDAAANQALDLLREVANGRDPYSLPAPLRSPAKIAICPYGCERTPRLTNFSPDPVGQWYVTSSITPFPNDEQNTTLRGSLTGTATLNDGKKRTDIPLDGSIVVRVSRENGANWEPVAIRIDPPLVPKQQPDGVVSLPTLPVVVSQPTQTVLPSSRLEMPATTPGPETVAEQRERADEVLMSISTLGVGEPLPYELRPQVVGQIKGIISRFAPPGQKVTGFSFEPVEWERIEVREQESLALVDPENTAAMVGYLEGSVWLTDKSGKRVPKPLNPLTDHLVINMELEQGRWVVTNVSDGKVDTHTPGSEGAP